MKPPIKVIIIDDQVLIRTGIAKLLEESKAVTVAACSGIADKSTQLIRDKSPDVVLLGVATPAGGELETIHRLQRQLPQVKILIIASETPDLLAVRLLHAGALGYITREQSGEELITAIKTVHAGKRYIADSVANQIALMTLNEEQEAHFSALTDREIQIMLMIVKGISVQEISARLFLSPKTINSYRYSIFEKLNVYNDVQLTLLALKSGFIARPYYVE